MSLSIGLDAANSGLAAGAQQTSVASRNIARVSQPGATRKIVNLATVSGGGVRVASITRASDEGLLKVSLNAQAGQSKQSAIAKSLATLATSLGDPQNNISPAALVDSLDAALQAYAGSSYDSATAGAAVTAARSMAKGLNLAANLVSTVRQKADSDIASSVDTVNSLLATFETVNTGIVQGTQTKRDTTDLEDQRDQILQKLSDEIGIRTFTRGNNDTVIQTDSGVTMFETKPRVVSFEASPFLSAGNDTNPVYVDGVPVTSQATGMPVSTGRIAGLVKVADDIAPKYGKQLDEMARGLITAFAETDQSATPSLPAIPGLFTYSGSPAMPAAGPAIAGLASSIKISPSVDPDQGGSINRLRDGGIGAPGNPAYVYNLTGASGYSDRIRGLMSSLESTQSFDPATGLKTQGTLSSFAADSASWLAGAHKTAASDADYQSIVLDRANTSLSNATGVNLDQEVTSMLDIERSYQASAKILGVINQMLDQLMTSVR